MEKNFALLEAFSKKFGLLNPPPTPDPCRGLGMVVIIIIIHVRLYVCVCVWKEKMGSKSVPG